VTTFTTTAELVIVANAAVIFVCPSITPVTKPPEATVATETLELVHVALDVKFTVLPSEYVPVAENCFIAFAAKIGGEAGVIAIDDKVKILRGTDGLAMPAKVADIFAFPSATPVAIPDIAIVAVDVSELDQVALEVTAATDPSA